MEIYVLVLVRSKYCAPDVAQYYSPPELVHIFPYPTNYLLIYIVPFPKQPKLKEISFTLCKKPNCLDAYVYMFKLFYLIYSKLILFIFVKKTQKPIYTLNKKENTVFS